MRGHAISNIAWPVELDAEVAGLMARRGFKGVELAPTKYWPRPIEVTREQARVVRDGWETHGIGVVALQALLFGRPELALFDDDAGRDAMLEHLRVVMRIGAWLGAGPLVFGSPRNRKRGPMERDRAMDVATDFFRRAGAAAADEGVVLCIEPNPPEYDCDFINRTAEALELVERVAHPGFGLHVDASQIALSREPMPEAVTHCADRIRHFHASEPMLGPIGEGGADHAAMAKALRSINYGNWVSIEMRQVPDRDVLPELARGMDVVRAAYPLDA